MKKITYILLVLICTLSACKKEETSLRIHTEAVGGSQKAYLYNSGSDYSLCLINGVDQININGETVTASSDNSNTGTVNVTKADNYRAVYPRSIVTGTITSSSSTSGITVNLPASQTYGTVTIGGHSYQKIDMPMAAYSATSDGTLYFRNLCALMKVNVKNSKSSTLTVTKIVVKSSTTPLSGTGSIGELDPSKTEYDPVINLNSGQSKEVALTLSQDNTVGVNQTRAFYIVLPKVQNTANRFTIEVQGALSGESSSKRYVKTQPDGLTPTPSSKYTIARNQLGAAAFDVNMDPYQPPFSVSATKKVIFAPGNLCSDNGGGNWHFQPNQWTQTVLNPRGMFYFSNNKSGNNGGINWTGDGTAYVNWGNMLPASLGTGWDLLTDEEWNYLRNTRSNASNKYRVNVTVRGVHGLVIVPDDWSGSISSSYDATAWATAESKGAVFLPRTDGGMVYSGYWPYDYDMYMFSGTGWENSLQGQYWFKIAHPDWYNQYHGTLYFCTDGNNFDITISGCGGESMLRAVRLAKEVH